jgi:EmrB/QacA subfamily drug resistance transporter
MPRDDLLGERPAGRRDPEANGGRMAFAFLMLAQLIASLDNQLVATALPTIVGDLGQAEHFSWLVTAYVLAQCAVMPISGKFGDLIGRKRVMVTSLLIFSVGAVFCAVSWSMSSLIMARLVQGLGTGGILVSVFAVNADLFEPGRRARFQSYLSFVFVVGSFVGPTLGGYLTAATGWRSIFLATLPLASLSILGFLRYLPGHVSGRRPVIDFAGAIAIALTVTILVIWTDSARIFGSFSAPESLFLALAAGLGLLLSALIERRAPEPVLPPGLLRQWNFSLLCVTTLCSGAVSLGLVTYYAYFLQMALGLSPAHSGLFFIALTVGVSSGALLSGQLMTRGWHFADPLRLSLLLGVAVLLGFSALPQHASMTLISAVFISQGLATGLGMNAVVLGAQATARPQDVGAATGAISLVRTIGAAFGIAIYGTIIALGLADMQQVMSRDISAVTPTMLAGLSEAVRNDLLQHYREAFATLFRCAALIAVCGFVASCLIRKTRR